MAAKCPALLLLVLLPFLLSSGAAGHQIVRLLSQFSQFSAFTSFVNQTKIPTQVQVHHSITILAVDDSAVSALSGLDAVAREHVLSVHIVLDYYDLEKFHDLRRRSTILTTLYQSSGLASNNRGFLNVTKLMNQQVAFGSAAPGAPLVATLIDSVTARPYNISVLQISGVIIPPGIDGTLTVQTPLPNIKPMESPPPEATPPSEEAADDASAPEADSSEEATSPSSSSGSPAPSPAVDDVADAVSPPQPADEKPATKSAAGRIAGSASLGLAMAVILSLAI